MVPNGVSLYKADTFILIRCTVFTWLTVMSFIMFVWKFNTVTSSVTTTATQYLMTMFTSNSGNTFEEGAMYWKVRDLLVGVSLSEPHSNVENSAVIHMWRTAAKMELQHILWFGTVVHVQTNMINLRILSSYKCWVMQQYLASFTGIPY